MTNTHLHSPAHRQNHPSKGFLVHTMHARSSAASCRLGNLVPLLFRYRVCSRNTTPNYQYHHGRTKFPKFGYGIGSSMHQGLSNFSGDTTVLNRVPEIKMVQEDKENSRPSVPAPPQRSILVWAKWLMGSIYPLLFSFWKQKLDNLPKLEGEVEEVVEEVENVAEVVGKVASKAEKVSAQVAEKLDDGELKEAALIVEHVSSVTAKDAQLTQDFIHKVGDLKQDFKDLESTIEPVVDRIEHVDKVD